MPLLRSCAVWGSIAVVVIVSGLFTVIAFAVAAVAAVRGNPKLGYRAWGLAMMLPTAIFARAAGLPGGAALVVGAVVSGIVLLAGQLALSEAFDDFTKEVTLSRGARRERRAGQPSDWMRAMRTQYLGVFSILFAAVPVLGFSSIPFALAAAWRGAHGMGSSSDDRTRRMYKYGLVGGLTALAISALFVFGIVALASDSDIQ